MIKNVLNHKIRAIDYYNDNILIGFYSSDIVIYNLKNKN